RNNVRYAVQFLDSQAPNVLVAECGLLLLGTKEGNCNRLPISVAMLLLGFAARQRRNVFSNPTDQVSRAGKASAISLMRWVERPRYATTHWGSANEGTPYCPLQPQELVIHYPFYPLAGQTVTAYWTQSL